MAGSPRILYKTDVSLKYVEVPLVNTLLHFHLCYFSQFSCQHANLNHELSLTLIWKCLSSILKDLTPILAKILTSDPYNS